MVTAAPACPSRRPWRRLSAGVAVLAAAVLAIGLTPSASADPPTPAPEVAAAPGTYIVTLADAPVAAYDGGVAGIKATRPVDGRRVEVNSSNAKRYRSYLRKQQDAVAGRVGVAPRSRFEISLSAFTAKMTTQQARTLAKTDGVVSVTKDVLRSATDDRNSVDYLRLSGSNGVWSALGGTAKAGRGVVVGVIDSGIWPESASVAGPALGSSPSGKFVPYRSGNKIVMTKSDGSTFTGVCQRGQDFTRDDCSTKLVGARYFGKAWLAQEGLEPGDFESARDGHGHGTHTASTAAGNNGVRAVVDGRDFGTVSGVAPAAKIAVYKALWKSGTGASGFTSDLVSAIDMAVADGVDVINYSVSDDDDPADPVQLAFLSAASAGIFVSASAGNDGPGASTQNHSSPWVTTVAASTLQPYYGTVTLGNGQKYVGISTSVTTAVGPAPLANASNLAAAAPAGDNAALCAANSLDPAKVAGKIVVCDRGVVDRVAKSAEVKRAGGVGMVLANLTENSLDGDLHTVPTVHVNPPASTAIKTYANTAGATATLTEGNQTTETVPYPQIASFSSRGPSIGTGGDTLKPDITAPGVAILAAVAPPSRSGRNFDFLSGTSMAAPHVAGLAALYYGVGVHPKWSPMRVKSALMTTAKDVKDEDGGRFTDPYAQGAGEVVPRKMLDPGLVYPAGNRDWLRYLANFGVETGVRATDPSDYNSPSIAIGSLLKRQTVTRRVTAVEPGVYSATVEGVPGVKVTVSPSILSFGARGETKSFKVTFDNRSADFDEAASGFLTWRGAGNTVRIPLVVTPKVVDAPSAVTGSGASGAISYTITPGVSGAFPIKAFGLSSGKAEEATKKAGESGEFDTTVPSGAKVAQFTARTASGQADLDLYLYRLDANNNRTLVAQSATGAANETIVLTAPAAGKYLGEVVVFGNAPNTTETTFTYRAAAVASGGGEGNFAVDPANPTARVGRPIELTARWSGLSATTPYIGWVEYPGGSGTIVTVN